MSNDLSFLGFSRLTDRGPANFSRAIHRLLLHLGFEDVFNIDGPGDGGADLIGWFDQRVWVIQCKWKKSAKVSEEAVIEAIQARNLYKANTTVVVTNTSFTAGAKRRMELANESSTTVRLWGFNDLKNLFLDPKVCRNRIREINFRPYQLEAYKEAKQSLADTKRALLVLATGLGKTVVAGELIANHFHHSSLKKILVLAHTNELVLQLERSIWVHIEKSVETQIVNQFEKPDDLRGITVSTIQSALPLVKKGYRPDFVFIDEAHHIGDEGMYAELLLLLEESNHLAVTATPWRSDKFDIQSHFGDACYRIGIAEGMKLGYLSKVNYKLFVDNINWEWVASESEYGYSIKDLNRKLFLPQRDERIRDELLSVWNDTKNPRAIVFCQTIEHAERMVALLKQVPIWDQTAALHNDIKPMRARQKRMLDFRFGRIPILVAVDVLNEGVDVPDVNIVVFARVTHSRKIFVQQLGRGLRIAEGKECVETLDFVSDLRRVAALMDLRASLDDSELETKFFPSNQKIEFNDAKAERLMTEWIKDAADLETAADATQLNFPPIS